jgi:putative membrane protein
MLLRYLIATLHLLILAIGIAAVYGRWRALRDLRTVDGLVSVFHADNWYGIAAVGWVITGLWRAFGGLEKGSEHYLESHWFLGKMGLFGIVFLLELYPMITLIRWRLARKRGSTIAIGVAPVLASLTFLQLPLLVLMVFMATALARGW